MSATHPLKIIAILVTVFCFSLCQMQCGDRVPQESVNHAEDSMRHDNAAGSATGAVTVPIKKQIDYSRLCGKWIKYDTVYKGRITSPDVVQKDIRHLQQKIDQLRKTGKCDGGCLFSSTYAADGSLHKRIDDHGEELRYCIDSANNKMVLLSGGKRAAKQDTINIVEITYLDDRYLLEYYINWPEPGTILYEKTGSRK